MPNGTGNVAHEATGRTIPLHPIVTFYLLAFGISWLGYIPILGRAYGLSLFVNRLWLAALILPAVGPGVAAMVVSRSASRASDKDSPGTSLAEAFFRQVSTRWWLAATLLPAGLMAAAAVLSRYLSPAHPLVFRERSLSSVVLFSLMSLAANPFEEIGWRGFAQRRLQRILTPVQAALIVGLLWMVWHLPLFALPGGVMSMADIPFWPWAAGVVPQAILLAWLYNRSNESLAVVSLFHISGNVFGYVLGGSVLMVSAVRILAALLVLCLAGRTLGATGSETMRATSPTSP